MLPSASSRTQASFKNTTTTRNYNQPILWNSLDGRVSVHSWKPIYSARFHTSKQKPTNQQTKPTADLSVCVYSLSLSLCQIINRSGENKSAHKCQLKNLTDTVYNKSGRRTLDRYPPKERTLRYLFISLGLQGCSSTRARTPRWVESLVGRGVRHTLRARRLRHDSGCWPCQDCTQPDRSWHGTRTH